MVDKQLDSIIEKQSLESIAYVLERLFDPKKLRILTFFFENPGKEFTLSEISKSSKVPIATTSRIIKLLSDLNIILLKEIKQLRLYRLSNNDISTFLSSFIIMKRSSPIEDFIDKIKSLAGIKSIIQHGNQNGQNKANLLIITDNESPENAKKIRDATDFVKNQYNFIISNLNLTEDQYDQMSNMGLYSGKKRVLYKKQ